MDGLKSCPDIIVFPTSFADHSEGALREFIDLKQQSKIDKLPRFILARADLTTGYKAKSIATDTTTKYVEAVIASSNGKSVFVSNEEMQKAKSEILRAQGWNVELSSAASIACLDKLQAETLKDKTVVIILTALEDK